ncbi:hypothetical protein [Couchioplanes azureus]|uniref:hypothetical protein n=1 Tax=Couchioplanes caeruleus TaxID=56438 RepID=UPI001E4B8C89|nr:hypothetical protein [Couchioplanes caeruleus]
MRVRQLDPPVDVEPPRDGEDAAECTACNTADESCVWVSERWRVRAMDRPAGLPMVLVLECRSHLDLGDLPNLLAAELGVMTVRLERAIRSLDGVARVHLDWSGDRSAHLHVRFSSRPYGRLQLRGGFLPLWDDILPAVPEEKWREDLALVAAWLAEFGGRAIAEPPHIHWQAPATFGETVNASPRTESDGESTADPAEDTANREWTVGPDGTVVGTAPEVGAEDEAGPNAGRAGDVGATVGTSHGGGRDGEPEATIGPGGQGGRAGDVEATVGTSRGGGRDGEPEATIGTGSRGDCAGEDAAKFGTGGEVGRDGEPEATIEPGSHGGRAAEDEATVTTTGRMAGDNGRS